MTKEQFIKLMMAVKEKYQDLEKFWDKFEDFFGVYSDLLVDTTSIGGIIDTIADIVEDKEKWIYWYIYENDWGKEERECIDKNDNVVSSETLEDLWNLIKGNN